MFGPFRRVLSVVQSAVAHEKAHRRYVRLLEADDATLRELGFNRSDLRLAFLLHQQPDDGDQGGRTSG